MKDLLRQFLIVALSTLFLIEFFSFLSIKLNIVKKNIPTWVTLHAHEDYGHWHPKNITFKNISAQCWKSTVSYNNYGMRGVNKISLKKKRERIALLGDSMIENIELSDGLDIGSQIQKKLPEYEILNFSSRATGLADQTDIYVKLIKKFDVDKIFLFVHYNDVINNSIHGNPKVYQRRYDYKDNKIVEIEKNFLWLENYNSKTNYFLRNKLIFLKQTNTYKVYLHLLEILKTDKQKEINLKKQKLKVNQFINIYEKQFEINKNIYEFLKKNFISVLDPNHELFVILNIFPFSFSNSNMLNEEDIFIKNKIIPFLENIWSDVNFIYPTDLAKEYILLNRLKFPYFSWTCDRHYNIHGSQFISDLVYNNVKKY
jgi:hypothetical protein